MDSKIPLFISSFSYFQSFKCDVIVTRFIICNILRNPVSNDESICIHNICSLISHYFCPLHTLSHVEEKKKVYFQIKSQWINLIHPIHIICFISKIHRLPWLLVHYLQWSILLKSPMQFHLLMCNMNYVQITSNTQNETNAYKFRIW